MNFHDLFVKKPVIACIHLLPLPGSPRYEGSMERIIETALKEADIFVKNRCDGLLVENFRDNPFYPGALPPETVAALTTLTCEIVNQVKIPVGVNALRNDAHSALAVAVASGANFIRVNIHTGAAVTDQGIIEGKACDTLRLRSNLKSRVLIFADVAVKHASPLVPRPLGLEVAELTERGLADAIIITGDGTGREADIGHLKIAKQNTSLPVLIGSGLTPDNVSRYYPYFDGMIIGSYFKKDGKADNKVEALRVRKFIKRINDLV
jgi:membrane complex biogenesis BtpA family protein